MTRDEAVKRAEKITDVTTGNGYYGRLWDAIADALLTVERDAAVKISKWLGESSRDLLDCRHEEAGILAIRAAQLDWAASAVRAEFGLTEKEN